MRAAPATQPKPAKREAVPKAPGADQFFPPVPKPTLSQFRMAAASCQGCELYKNATQTVFGDGAQHAAIMLVGEQPANREYTLGEGGRRIDSSIRDPPCA